jgi:hypothetical protein
MEAKQDINAIIPADKWPTPSLFDDDKDDDPAGT